MSQCDSILRHLQEGNSVTPAQAYELFGTLALHSRVAELRERGTKIDCELVNINGKKVGRYSLGVRDDA